MRTPTLWKITCPEDALPGLWQRWLKCQCATIGYSPQRRFQMEGGKKTRDWITARNALKEIAPGDFIVATLPHRQIGKLGEVIRNEAANDEWNPLLPPDSDSPHGYHGRRILVRWDLEHGPDTLDLVVQLPENFTIGWRGTANRVRDKTVKQFQRVMDDPANWVGLHGHFGYEEALFDYIVL